MNKANKLKQWGNFILYTTLQVAITQSTAPCFVYIAFFLLLPRRQDGETLFLLISFFIGLFIDTFYNSIGTHVFASVLMVYSRGLLLRFVFPTSTHDTAVLSSLGWKGYALFALILISIHHTALFFLDAGSITPFFVIMRKVLYSTLLTYTVVLTTQSITFLSRKR